MSQVTFRGSFQAIAIDGPAASGKSTIGCMLADRLSFLFLDSGCMYRAVTLAALQRGFRIDDEPSIVAMTKGLTMDIQPPAGEGDGRLYTVTLDGQDVTWELRSSRVDSNVSQVSAYNGVRELLVARQREIAYRGRVVAVGRDIGTVVLPDAPLKLYIVASAEERAQRRWHERKDRDRTSSQEQILADIIRRDRIDSQRRYSPMRPAGDALIIDSTGRRPEDLIEEILALEHFEQDGLLGGLRGT